MAKSRIDGHRSEPCEAEDRSVIGRQKGFLFEPPLSPAMTRRGKSDCRECFLGQSLVYFKTLQTLFSTHANGLVGRRSSEGNCDAFDSLLW